MLKNDDSIRKLMSDGKSRSVTEVAKAIKVSQSTARLSLDFLWLIEKSLFVGDDGLYRLRRKTE